LWWSCIDVEQNNILEHFKAEVHNRAGKIRHDPGLEQAMYTQLTASGKCRS
jgi:hypothetical protein